MSTRWPRSEVGLLPVSIQRNGSSAVIYKSISVKCSGGGFDIHQSVDSKFILQVNNKTNVYVAYSAVVHAGSNLFVELNLKLKEIKQCYFCDQFHSLVYTWINELHQ